MKKIILTVLILFAGKIFSQSDSIYKTNPVFSIKYSDFNNKEFNLEDIRLTSIDSTSLSFDETIYGPSTAQNKYRPHVIDYSRIKSFGYKSGLTRGEVIRNGAIIGFGLGFVIGFIMGKIDWGGHGSNETKLSQRIGTAAGFGLFLAIPTALLTTIFSLDHKEYENLNLSVYDNRKKFEIIKRLIKKGVKENM